MVRSRNIIPEGVPNSHICAVRSLIKLWKICPAKFHRDDERVLDSWRSGKPINPDRALALLRMAVSEQGMRPASFSLHSLRAGGRPPYTGRTETLSWSPGWGGGEPVPSPHIYGGGHEIMRGLGKLMIQGDTRYTVRRAI